MKIWTEQIAGRSLVMLAVIFLSINAVAGQYNYEAGLSYENSSTGNSSSLFYIDGNPGSQIGSATTSSNLDQMELSGTWFYSGLSDNSGPKSRAAFIDRASGVRLAYSYSDLSASFVSSGLQPPLPPGALPTDPSSGSVDGTTHELEVSLRHVWPASGWYGLAGVARVDFELNAIFDGVGSSNGADESVYTLGIGKYLSQATALDLRIVSTDLGRSDTMAYVLSFIHVGSLGSGWHYAADLGVAGSEEDGDDGTYSLGVSLFPTTEVEFGIQIVHQESEFYSDSDTYKGFARWFIRDHLELHALYGAEDLETHWASDRDNDQLSVGMNIRF